MGYIKHNVIVITSWDKKILEKARGRARKLFKKVFKQEDEEFRQDGSKLVSPIIKGIANGYFSFFIAPDGSKEGWSPSQFGDEAREKFMKYVYSLDYEDGSNPLDFVEIEFGGDLIYGGGARIVNSNSEPIEEN